MFLTFYDFSSEFKRRYMWHRERKAGSGLTPDSGVEMRVARSDEIVKCVLVKHFYVYQK